MEDEDLSLAVKKGAAWLDEVQPGWASKINLSDFNMNLCDRCIIGQAIGDYFNTITRMFEVTGNPRWEQDHGFDLPYGSKPDHWRILENFWAFQVKERLT